MHVWTKTALVATTFGAAVWFGAPALAQRTGDHIVPAIEKVCEGDPYNFGLCNAYCEALDCESPTPLGTPRACSNLLRNYRKHSGGVLPPCECPCAFDLEGDFEQLIALAADPINGIPADITGNFQSFCTQDGPGVPPPEMFPL